MKTIVIAWSAVRARSNPGSGPRVPRGDVELGVVGAFRSGSGPRVPRGDVEPGVVGAFGSGSGPRVSYRGVEPGAPVSLKS